MTSGSRLGFLRIGTTLPSFIASENTPKEKDKLIMCMIRGARPFKNSFGRSVRMESNGNDFVGQDIIRLEISCSDNY